MYEAPIKLLYSGPVYKEIVDAQERQIFQAVQSVVVDVDKDELIKALAYDRDQYEKGFADGIAYKPPVLSKYDQIHQMSIDELAQYLADIAGWLPEYEGKAHAVLNWLRSEADA